jgi:hypothetical protein
MLSTTIWWTCPDCGVDAELAGPDHAPGLPACPDCEIPMAESWRWETVAA